MTPGDPRTPCSYTPIMITRTMTYCKHERLFTHVKTYKRMSDNSVKRCDNSKQLRGEVDGQRSDVLDKAERPTKRTN